MALRPTTNLLIPDELRLPKAEARQGFMYIYSSAYTGYEPVFYARLWSAVLFPSLERNPAFGKVSAKEVRLFAQSVDKKTPSGYLKIKKVNGADPHFEASLPLVAFNPHSIAELGAHVQVGLVGKTAEADFHSDVSNAVTLMEQSREMAKEQMIQHRYSKEKVLAAVTGLTPIAKAELGKCMIDLTIDMKGSLAVVFLNVRISKAQAEQLTTTPWMEIRNMDLYPLLLSWVTNGYGYMEKAPVASFPISKIANSLPPVPEGQARVNEHNISVGHQGTPYFLPKQLDNTARYETQVAQVGEQPDGTFGLINVSAASKMIELGKDVVAKLPPNIPVLIDWVNNKYAYTTTSGRLEVLDLVRFRAADETHIVNILNRFFFLDKTMTQIQALAATGGVPDMITMVDEDVSAFTTEFPQMANSPVFKKLQQKVPAEEYWAHAEALYKTVEGVTEIPMHLISVNGSPLFRPVARYIKAAHTAVLEHLDAIYAKYSVHYVAQVMATITLMAKYTDDFATLKAKDEQNRAAAVTQGVDPNWQMPSVPLVSDRFGVLPHQKKVRNLLKDSPDFAILPVQAGGGKTPLAILDVLLEIKANRSQPYLILCPPHLVAQYTKEIVFFTAGQLNVVPINTYILRHSSEERLEKILASAPRNTVVITDYDVLRYKQHPICYGTSTIMVYPVINFLRKFNFGYVMMDESHLVKNDSGRTKACMALITDIKKKRLASGTMTHDSPSDLALQIAMLDPTLFGSREEFNNKFGDVVKGNRVSRWKPGAQQQIMRMIKSRVVVAGAMRREWAALLPQAREFIHKTELTEAQRAVYQAILKETLDLIKEEAKTNKGLAQFLNPEEREEEEDPADEDAGDDLAALLQPYLARLEQFITAPGKDVIGARVLRGDDLISPKVRKIIDIVREHLEKNIEGKVLIFTNYIISAEEIYNLMPADIKSKTILYTAAEKIEAGAAFENDDRMRVMVGVEASMNTGLNLQFASRLIRTETVWNPGTLEQGNSRVNRPELKKADRRDWIYYDWVVANSTIDITKISRLMSKVIACAKFENAESGLYDDVPDVDVVPMTLNTIEAMNSWDTDLREYAEAYSQFQIIQRKDYEDYRAKHGELKLEALTKAPVPVDAKLLTTVPYTPGAEIYGSGNLGLVRLDEYLRSDDALNAIEDESTGGEEEDEEESTDPSQEQMRKLVETLKGQPIHTEFGDGVIRRISTKLGKVRRVTVEYPDGQQVVLRQSVTYLITKPLVDTARAELLRQVGDIETTIPVELQSTKAKRGKASAKWERERQAQIDQARKERDEAGISLEVQFSVTNGFLGLTYFLDKDQPEAAKALEALGFHLAPDFMYARFPNAARLMKQFNLWKEKGFTFDSKVNSQHNLTGSIRDMYDLLKSGQIKNHREVYKFSTANKLANFYKMEQRPSIDPKAFKPFPIIEDGQAYIVLPVKGQAATKTAIRVKAPGVVWKHSDPALVYYGLNPARISAKLKEMIESNIQISNIEDLRAEFSKLRKAKLRDLEAEAELD